MAVPLDGGASVAPQGCAAASGWAVAAAGLIETAEHLDVSARRGAVECVARDVARVVAWDRAARLALVFGDGLSGPTATARFRSTVARWREICRPCMGGDRGAVAGAARVA